MEGHGSGEVYQEMKDNGFEITYTIMDGDASSRKSVEVKPARGSHTDCTIIKW